MLDSEFMRLEKEGKLAWLTFTRKNHLNAMNNACIDQLNRIAMTLREDSNVRVVIIRGEGRAFSTGIDLKELAADRIEMDYHHRWEKALRQFEAMEMLAIVGMHNYCLGGALQLALAADIRVSTTECQIGLPAIKESLIPGLATMRLPRYIGWGRAKKMILGCTWYFASCICAGYRKAPGGSGYPTRAYQNPKTGEAISQSDQQRPPFYSIRIFHQVGLIG